MNRLDKVFIETRRPLLSVYTVVGYPSKDASTVLLHDLCRAGVDFIELGIPFSDPVADGTTIQGAHQTALQNGTKLRDLFVSAQTIRQTYDTPLVAMGYINPVLQYGFDRFLLDAAQAGIDGLILPDLPPEVYEKRYRHQFDAYGIHPIFLISPNTPAERINYLDSLSKGFIYAVSSLSVTGSTGGELKEREVYLQRIAQMKLKNPVIVGFGIRTKDDFNQITPYTRGGITGSAFIEYIKNNNAPDAVHSFVGQFR